MLACGNYDREIEDNQIIIKALKRQQPMMVIPEPEKYGKYFKCPACQATLQDSGGVWEVTFESETPDWCPDCGQHLIYPVKEEQP